MTVTVIIPTYKRPGDLFRCLTAIRRQERAPNRVLIVVRDTDVETRDRLAEEISELPTTVLTVHETGVVAAMNVGLRNATGDIIVFTDDDSTPHSTWLARIEQHYLNGESIGGVGGRDRVHLGTKVITGEQRKVGKVQLFGRIIGNHHVGSVVQEVDVLKGVNMSFRRRAIDGMLFDTRMKGTGAQVHFEVEFCLKLKRAGWTLIYDPEILVDHFPAQRFDEDRRQTFNELALTNAAHNETLALVEHFSNTRRALFLVWALAIGTRSKPGLLQWLRRVPREGRLANRSLSATLKGRREGLKTWRHGLGQST